MYVEFAEEAQDWDDWVFGDLSAAICRTVEVVGPSADVIAVSARMTGIGLPRVVLLVPSVEDVARLRHEAGCQEFVAHFSGYPNDSTWEADVNGVRLVVGVTEDDS